MKHSLCLSLSLLVLTGCNEAPASPEPKPADLATNQQDELAKQKLTIEQAAEEATKLIEADAKAEIDVASSVNSEPTE